MSHGRLRRALPGVLQLLIDNLEDVLAERDPDKRQAQLESLLSSLRATLDG